MLAALLAMAGPVTLAQLQAVIRPQRVALATLFRSMLRLEDIELVTRTIDLHGTANWQLNVGRPREFRISPRDTGSSVTLDWQTAQPLRELLDRIEQRLRERGYTHLQLSVAFRGTDHPSAHGEDAPAARRHVA